WRVLGQSFGGFCALTYLSFAPQGLAGVMIAGGLPGLSATADEVYREAYPRAIAANDRFFAEYPADRKLARQVLDHLSDVDTRLPGGERLTPHRFQMLGITLGTKGSYYTIHDLLETAFIESNGRTVLSDSFLRGVDAVVSMASSPLYAL